MNLVFQKFSVSDWYDKSLDRVAETGLNIQSDFAAIAAQLQLPAAQATPVYPPSWTGQRIIRPAAHAIHSANPERPSPGQLIAPAPSPQL